MFCVTVTVEAVCASPNSGTCTYYVTLHFLVNRHFLIYINLLIITYMWLKEDWEYEL